MPFGKDKKSWNGVAILSKGYDITEVQDSLPGDDEDVQSRYLEVIIEKIVICCLYIPNGNPYPGEKYEYKLSWLNRLKKRADELLDLDIPAILIGDFNIIPTPSDVYKPEKYKNDALFTEEVRKSFEGLVNSGWKDSLRSLNPDKEIYTFWDYMFKAYNRNAGMRIDHILLSPYLESRLET
ncbi:exodeoxyribonuclease III [Chryseobacterium arachidis]|uniref:exodeoxyribonuclease III n=1 Tax=Chryseobacterium arachidis TaxID=1416778 RepID=UPI0036144364